MVSLLLFGLSTQEVELSSSQLSLPLPLSRLSVCHHLTETPRIAMRNSATSFTIAFSLEIRSWNG